MKAQKFSVWFKAQFGDRKNSKEFKKLSDLELHGVVVKGLDAKDELYHRNRWDMNKAAALKAWCAKESNSDPKV
jgi:hypothetical protein